MYQMDVQMFPHEGALLRECLAHCKAYDFESWVKGCAAHKQLDRSYRSIRCITCFCARKCPLEFGDRYKAAPHLWCAIQNLHLGGMNSHFEAKLVKSTLAYSRPTKFCSMLKYHQILFMGLSNVLITNTSWPTAAILKKKSKNRYIFSGMV